MHGRNDLSKDDLLTAGEVCRKFKVSYKTLDKMRRDPIKRFPQPIKVGRSWLYSLEELNQWYHSAKEPSPHSLESDLVRSLEALGGEA